MVEYPNISSLNNNSGISGLLALPNASFPLFWTTIIGGIFIILTFTMYFSEKSLKGRGNMLSSMAVSSLACIFLAGLGSLFGIFTVTTFIPILVFGIMIIVVWIISVK